MVLELKHNCIMDYNLYLQLIIYWATSHE